MVWIWLLVGCEIVILFLMCFKKIFGSVYLVRLMRFEFFSVCIWVKVIDVLNKIILFFYGIKRNLYEI